MMIVADAIADIKDALKDVDEDSLVIFDCDDVLTTLREHIWKRQNHAFFLKWCAENIPEGKNLPYDVADFILVSSENFLVDAEMPSIIESLYSGGIKAVVLTALSTKPIGEITDPLGWRVMMLKKLGYDFGKFWPSLPNKYFDEFGCEYPPMYGSGVICSCDISKGEVMEAFLRHFNVNPLKVVFIDDKKESVESVAASCHRIGIECAGIQYLGADKVVSQVPFSKKMMTYQLQMLKEKNVWIPDAEAASHRAGNFSPEEGQHFPRLVADA
ncbi:MAG: DUF2608 domain-containing protein [Puniceicoccales bacterium]|jgi:hypothetical protein|nr:DUF2608 domain-containing protein [Puniceicoccales bacterium]